MVLIFKPHCISTPSLAWNENGTKINYFAKSEWGKLSGNVINLNMNGGRKIPPYEIYKTKCCELSNHLLQTNGLAGLCWALVSFLDPYPSALPPQLTRPLFRGFDRNCTLHSAAISVLRSFHNFSVYTKPVLRASHTFQKNGPFCIFWLMNFVCFKWKHFSYTDQNRDKTNTSQPFPFGFRKVIDIDYISVLK